MTNLIILEKSFNRIENYISNYIYKKYIKEQYLLENIEEDTETSREEYNYSKYLHTIFNYERVGIITQLESIETDLNNMSIADKEYETNPKTFKTQQYKSLPDIKKI